MPDPQSPPSPPSREPFQEIPNPYNKGPRLPRAGARLPARELPPHPAIEETGEQVPPSGPPGYVMPGSSPTTSRGHGSAGTRSSIAGPVIFWSVFWGLWIIPGCFPLMGLPGGLILIVLAPHGKWDLQATIMLTFMMALWGWLSLGITVLWCFVSVELARRTETLSFSVVYVIVFLIPVLLVGFLLLLGGFM